jgi:plasmid stability protein
MSTLHVRNVPPIIYRALRKRAKERRSTVSAETIRLLDRALEADRPGVRALLAAIERTRPVARRGTPSAAELIRGDRDRR